MSNTPPGLIAAQTYFVQTKESNHVKFKVFTSKPYALQTIESLSADFGVVNYQLDLKTARPSSEAVAGYSIEDWVREVVVLYGIYIMDTPGEVLSDFDTENWVRERVVAYKTIVLQQDSFEADFDTLDWVLEKTTGYLNYSKEPEKVLTGYTIPDWEKGTE